MSTPSSPAVAFDVASGSSMLGFYAGGWKAVGDWALGAARSPRLWLGLGLRGLEHQLSPGASRRPLGHPPGSRLPSWKAQAAHQGRPGRDSAR